MKQTLLLILGAFTCISSTLAEEMVLGRSLTLKECIARAIRENPDLKSEQLNVLIGKEEIRTELAAFAWNFEASSVLEQRDKPQNAREASATNSASLRNFGEDNWRNRMAFTRRFSHGTTIDLGARHSIGENDLSRNPLFTSFTTEHEVFVGVTLTQPLLRGFGRRSNLAATDLARLKAESARMLTLIKAMNLVAEVASRYTDVVAAQKNLLVKSENIDRAKALVERNKKLLDAGKGVERDITTAELAVIQRRDDYLAMKLQKVRLVNSLADLINIGPAEGEQGNLIPVSGFGSEKSLPKRKDLIDGAMEKRTDLAYYRAVIESAEINILRARDGSRPSLNLVGTAGLYGLNDTTKGAMEEAIENQGGEFSIGVEFRIADLGGQAGKATIAIARKQKEQAEIGYRKARNTIALEVDTSYRSVLNLRERLEASYKARDLAERNLEAEELLLEQSKGDLYRVIERQQLCGDANTNVVASNALLSKAIIALWLTSGQLFERYAINEEWINPVAEGSGRKHPNGGPARDYGSFGLPFVNRGRGNPR
ncbi:MAG: hypothetical protein CMN05_03620 [Roseibacillus sp.]|jgi:outer membrane protein TolC|nr:hypothetical protein [Roseibacillus sp.]MBP36008.1 hypothetical protein [Roseibacillus sp.]HJM64627.1 TolC family protein [Roseibacillus sp.]|tara:strand:- start:1084 stop:2709 length:1626 start_codon:yes stop_codon:yes gene_type:complete